MMMDSALIITLAASLTANIFLCGYLKRWRHYAKFWREKFHETVTPVEPPKMQSDPYAGVKEALDYDWEGSWD